MSHAFTCGVNDTTTPIANASNEPLNIPNDIVRPMNAPTYPFYSPSTVCGAFIAHKVPVYPLEKEKRA